MGKQKTRERREYDYNDFESYFNQLDKPTTQKETVAENTTVENPNDGVVRHNAIVPQYQSPISKLKNQQPEGQVIKEKVISPVEPYKPVQTIDAFSGDGVIEGSNEDARNRLLKGIQQGRETVDPLSGQKLGGLKLKNAPTGDVQNALGTLINSGLKMVPGTIEALGLLGDKLAQGYNPLTIPTPYQMQTPEKTVSKLTGEAGKFLREQIDTIAPVDENVKGFFSSSLPSAVGSGLGFLAGGFIGKAAKLPTLLSTMLLSTSQAAEEYNTALQITGDEDKAYKTFIGNLPFAATEVLPFERLFSRLDKLGGRSGKQLIIDMFTQGTVEGAQEVIQQFGANLNTKMIYDSSKSLSEGTLDGGLAGFVTGMLMTGIGNAATNKLNDGNLSEKEITELTEAIKNVNLAKSKVENIFKQEFENLPVEGVTQEKLPTELAKEKLTVDPTQVNQETGFTDFKFEDQQTPTEEVSTNGQEKGRETLLDQNLTEGTKQVEVAQTSTDVKQTVEGNAGIVEKKQNTGEVKKDKYGTIKDYSTEELPTKLRKEAEKTIDEDALINMEGDIKWDYKIINTKEAENILGDFELDEDYPINKLINNIKKNGIKEPIVLGVNGIEGHHRLYAAMQLGLDNIPILESKIVEPNEHTTDLVPRTELSSLEEIGDVGSTSTPTPKVEKQPYEMSEAYVMSKKAEKDFPIESKVEIVNGKPVYKYSTTVPFGDEVRTFEITSKGQPSDMASRLHKKIVQQAISEGKIKSHPDYPELTAKEENKTLGHKVTGSLFVGRNWKQFIDEIPNHFLPTFREPLKLENQSDVLADNITKTYSDKTLQDFIDDVKKYPNAKISIEISDKGKNYKTTLPKETISYLVEKLQEQGVEKPVSTIDKLKQEAKQEVSFDNELQKIKKEFNLSIEEVNNLKSDANRLIGMEKMKQQDFIDNVRKTLAEKEQKKDNNKTSALRMFGEGKKDTEVVTALGLKGKAGMDQVREWRKEYRDKFLKEHIVVAGIPKANIQKDFSGVKISRETIAKELAPRLKEEPEALQKVFEFGDEIAKRKFLDDKSMNALDPDALLKEDSGTGDGFIRDIGKGKNTQWILSDYGQEIYDKLKQRENTRLRVKRGEDLFPEYAGIPLDELLEKPEFQEEINEEENSRIRSIEEQTKAIESKTESLESDEQRIEQLNKIDDLIAEIDEELKLQGVYEAAVTAQETRNEADKLFKKDLKKFAKEIQKGLGYEPDRDKKGKDTSVSTNIAPVGGDGTIILWKPNSDYGVYIDVSVDRDYISGEYEDKDKLTIRGMVGSDRIMWRVTTKQDKYRGLANQWIRPNVTAGEFARLIKRAVDESEARGTKRYNPQIGTVEEQRQQAKDLQSGKLNVTTEKQPDVTNIKEGRPFKGTIYDKNLELLKKVMPYLNELKQGDHFRLVSKPYMPLTVEVYENTKDKMILYLSHNYIQNGDLMDDPFMSVRIDKNLNTVEALEFQQSSTGTYGAVYPEEGKVNQTEKSGQNSFLNMWLKNLEAQGFDQSQRYEPNKIPLRENYDAEYWDSIFKPEENIRQDSGETRLVEAIFNHLQIGKAIGDNKQLSQMADIAFGGTKAQGKYQSQDAYNALEAAVNKWITENKIYGLPNAEALAKLRGVLKLLPTQTNRNDAKDLLQQFSTPPTLSYFAAKLLNPNKKDIILEPSAGTGSLVSFIKDRVADVYTNEIDPKRKALLEYLGYKTSSVDAEFLHSLLPQDIQPSKIIMNPPFSATGGRVKQNSNKFGYKHLQSALTRLQEGGRLVAILGEGAEFGKPEAQKLFWDKVTGKYNVRADIGIENNDYGKYGTSFGNRIIVIDKTGPTPNRLPELKGNYKTIEEALNATDKIISTAPTTLGNDTKDVSLGTSPQGTGTSGDIRGTGTTRRGEPGRESISANVTKSESGESNQRVSDKEGIQPRTTKQTSSGIGREVEQQRTEPRRAKESAGNDTGSSADIGAIDYEETTNTVKEAEKSGFVEYKPKKKIKGSAAHPAKLVETASMAAVEVPDITYKPKLPESSIKDGKISDAQLETISLIGQRHNLIFPNGKRAGFFVGDGTGVGKGRIIAGSILDNWNQGRKKILWLSVSTDLMKDAKRDLDGVGANSIPIKLINDFKVGDAIPIEYNGIVFSTYSSFISERENKSRIQQLVDWLGEDSILVFDEAHKAKNVLATGRGGKPTKTAQAIVDIQETHLPQARVIYASATGATDVKHMGYMTRLGMWGDKMPFPNFGSFMNEIESGGIGAMEMVARDLKALGMYSSRSISFDGIEYTETEHTLTPEQRRMYNTAAEAWQIVMQNIDEAIEITGNSTNAKRWAYSAFWGAHQRFFKQFITSLKVPTLLKNVDKYLADDKSVVISMIGTHEASTSRKVNEKLAEGESLDDLDLSPREVIAQMVTNAFPVVEYEEYTDENGNTKTRPLIVDGRPVENPQAVQMRERLLDRLADINLPENPLDQIINYYELRAKNENNPALRVAELTGRKKRLTKEIIKNPDTTAKEKFIFGNKISYTKRVPKDVRSKDTNIHEMDQFQKGHKRIAIITQAASTGISLHADKNTKNNQRRVQIAAELSWSADTQMQTFGRTHRSNQEVPPIYDLLSSDVGGEKRFASTIAKRLASLGALTKGERGATGGGQLAKYDFENEYGEATLANVYRNMLADEKIQGINGSTYNVLKQMGIIKQKPDGGEGIADEDITKVTLFLNRVLGLDIDTQNALFNYYADQFENVVMRAKESGSYDEGVTDIKANSIKVIGEPKTVYTDQLTNAETKHYELEVVKPTTPMAFRNALSYAKNGDHRGFYTQKKTGSVLLKLETNYKTDPMSGNLKPTVVTINPHGNRNYIPGEEFNEKYSKITQDEAKPIWDAKFDEVPKTKTEKMHIISGAILPLWKKLRTSGDEKIKVVRALTDTKQRIVGVQIPNHDVGSILKSLNIQRDLRTPQEIFDAVLYQGEQINLSNDLALKRVRLSGDNAIELIGTGDIGLDSNRFDEFKELGLIYERINFKPRFFVPTDEDLGPSVLVGLLETYPAVQSGGETLMARSEDRPIKSDDFIFNTLQDFHKDATVMERVDLEYLPEKRIIVATRQEWIEKYNYDPIINKFRIVKQGEEGYDPKQVKFRGESYGGTIQPTTWRRGKIAIYGRTDMATILEETVHIGQAEVKRRYPDLAGAIEQFENSARKQAKARGIDIPLGQELFAKSFVAQTGYKTPENTVVIPQLIYDEFAKFLNDSKSGEPVFDKYLKPQKLNQPASKQLPEKPYGFKFNEQGKLEVLSAKHPEFAPPFFSKLQTTIDAKLPKNFNAKQLNDILRSGEIKEAEIKWSGIDDFLKEKIGKGEKITKQEVMDFLKMNELQVKEIKKGGEERRDLSIQRNPDDPYLVNVIDEQGNIIKENISYSNASDYIDSYHDGKGDTKFAQYTLPDGENYREILFTLPRERKSRISYRNDADLSITYLSREEAQKSVDDYNKNNPQYIPAKVIEVKAEWDMDNPEFKSTHWDEPNVLAHTRVNDRTVNGKKYLHIEEVQSDYSIALRKFKGEIKNLLDDKTTFERVIAKMNRDKKIEIICP